MRRPYLTRADFGGVVLAFVLLALAILASVFGPQIIARVNYGFGREWDCRSPGKGGPVCVRRAVDSRRPN